MNNWISVSEKLPTEKEAEDSKENSVVFLVITRLGFKLATYEPCNSKWWPDHGGYPEIHNVTHWQSIELPESTE